MSEDPARPEPTALTLASEETPLLQANTEVLKTHPGLEESSQQANGHQGIDNQSDGAAVTDGDDDDRPLPMLQIILLCYCRVVEPIAFFSIFPYINKMIAETGGVREEDVGFYSGLIESLFSLTQMVLMLSWGRASDRFGRKPVLASSLFGCGICISFFGLSRSVWQMILFRCLAGVFSGTVVTLRTMTSELSTPKTQARAFSYFAFVGNLGIFIGPLIGGALADPAKQYGGPFKNNKFFHEYPYALPSFVSGGIGISAALIASFFVQETLEKKPPTDSTKPAPIPMTTWEVITSPGVPTVLFFYNWILLLGIAYTAVVPVFWYTNIALGGLNLTPIQISAFLGAGGLSQAIWTLVVFPPAQNRWGTIGVLRYCTIVWPISFALCPLANAMLRAGWHTAFWILMPISTVLLSGVSMAFTGVLLALNDISPTPAVLGTLNAVAMAMVCGIRAVAPALFASLFATGVKKTILGGYFVWAILIVLACGATVGVKFLPEKAHGKVTKKKIDDGDEEERA